MKHAKSPRLQLILPFQSLPSLFIWQYGADKSAPYTHINNKHISILTNFYPHTQYKLLHIIFIFQYGFRYWCRVNCIISHIIRQQKIRQFFSQLLSSPTSNCSPISSRYIYSYCIRKT